MESHVILSPVLEVLTRLEFYEKQQDRRGRRKSNEHLNLAVDELQRMMKGQLISGKDVIRILLFVWANCDGYEQNFFPSKIEYDDDDDVNVFLKRFRVSTEAFIRVISRCDLLHDLRWVLKDVNDTYLNERITSAVLLLSQNEASIQIVDIMEKQNAEGEDRDYQTSFLQTNTILRLERHKSVEEKNNDGDSLNTSSHFHGALEKEMVKVMNRINCEKEISVKEALQFSRSLLPLKLSSPAKFTQLLLHYAAENSSNMPLILSAAYNSPGLIELEFFIRAFRDLVAMKPHLLTALNVFTASLFNANMARMHTDGNGNYDTSLFDPREGILYVVLPLLHSSHESSVVEFAIHLLRDITIDGTQFDYTLVFRTYPGSILLSLASVVNARRADDGYSERVRELASSTLSVYVDRFEQLVKEERIHLTKHGLESIERLRSVATGHLDWDTRLRIEPVLQYGLRKRDVVNEKSPPILNCKFDSVTLWIKNVLVDIFCISRSGDEVLLRVVRVLFPFGEEVMEGEEEIVSNIDVSLVQFRSILEEVAVKYRDHLKVALLWASSEVFPRCTFSEIQRIVFGLFPKLLSQFAVMLYDRNARTCEDEMETDGITLDLFVKVIKTTRNTTDIGILTRQLANIVSSSPRDSFAFQLLGFRSLCSALSVVSVSSRGRSKSRAEGALSAAAFDILAKVVSSSKSQECKKKILEEMLAYLPTADLPDIAKQIKLEISKI
jgi:hypothetical protein